MAALSLYHGALYLDTGDGTVLHCWYKDVWRAVEAWSIVTTRGAEEWPPSGCMGRRDYETVYWETDDGRRFLFPYETAVLIMTGELKEAMATRDPHPGPPKPAPGALVEREAMPERRDWWGAREE